LRREPSAAGLALWIALLSLCVWHASAQAGEAATEQPVAEPKFQLSLERAIEALPFGVHGFFETRAGTRLQQDRTISETASIGESRLQLELSKRAASSSSSARASPSATTAPSSDSRPTSSTTR